jgi:hypothetical protein
MVLVPPARECGSYAVRIGCWRRRPAQRPTAVATTGRIGGRLAFIDPRQNDAINCAIGWAHAGGSCSNTFVFVDATYHDPANRAKHVSADSFNGDVALNVDDVGSGYSVQHGVFFNDCTVNCEVLFTTHPK